MKSTFVIGCSGYLFAAFQVLAVRCTNLCYFFSQLCNALFDGPRHRDRLAGHSSYCRVVRSSVVGAVKRFESDGAARDHRNIAIPTQSLWAVHTDTPNFFCKDPKRHVSLHSFSPELAGFCTRQFTQRRASQRFATRSGVRQS